MRRYTANPEMIADSADSLSDLFMFDEFKSRESLFQVNLGFLEAVFLQPRFVFEAVYENEDSARRKSLT